MKSCRILPSLLLLGALLLGASALPATTATFSVPFRINPSTRTIQIACEIESQPGKVLRCTIDTGAQGSVGGSTAVSGASLLLAKFVTMLTPGGSQLARETEQVLIVGDTKIPILLEVIANPERLDGDILIGQVFLQQFSSVRIDYTHHVVTFETK